MPCLDGFILMDYLGDSFLSVLFPLTAHFGQFLGLIWGRKMGEGKTPGVAAQKTRFGVKNGSTMPTIDRPLLCKKWPLIFKKHRKIENMQEFLCWYKNQKVNSKAR